MGGANSRVALQQQVQLEFDQHAVVFMLPGVRKRWWGRNKTPRKIFVPLGDIRSPVAFASAQDVLHAAQHAKAARGRCMQGVMNTAVGSVFYHIFDGLDCLAINTFSGHPFAQLLVQVSDGSQALHELDAAVKAWSRAREHRGRSLETTLETCVVCLAPIAPVAGQHWRCPHCSVALHGPCWKEWMLSSGDALCPHCMQTVGPVQQHTPPSRPPPPPATPIALPRSRTRIAPPPSPNQPIYLEQQPIAPATLRPLHPTTSAPPALRGSPSSIAAWDEAMRVAPIVPDRWASVGSAITDLPERRSIDTQLITGRVMPEEGSGTSEDPSSFTEDGLPLPMGVQAWRSSSTER